MTAIQITRKLCAGSIGGTYNPPDSLISLTWSVDLQDSKGIDNTHVVWHNIPDTSIVSNSDLVHYTNSIFLLLGMKKNNIKVKKRI